ncbi:hypothetical protein KGF56_004127 [Candida oxycetoniae]|uniref:Uncharacterized protein n=1 Tax=Candida oxycetoniae TaxID=497107 RepID=A0AAI9WWI5_9ASCO|nr:uncharacterized protein KGF56_004127 [Candida oxycetoniae]KAI3403067.2 hypothetical protein KGF56_004127 [Candida oxycetoniae]
MVRHFTTYYPIHLQKSVIEKPISQFNPIAEPNDASAVYTNLGWFYIPLCYNDTLETANMLNTEFEKQNFTLSTNREVIQQFIYQWCGDSYISLNLGSLRRHVGKVAEAKAKLEKSIYKQQTGLHTRGPNKDKMQKPRWLTKSDKEIRKENGKLRFKIDEKTGKIEMKGEITFVIVYNYFLQLKFHQVKGDPKYKGMKKSEMKEIFNKEWHKMDIDGKWQKRQEYIDLLLSGKDIVKGEIVDLETTLLEEPLEDGYRLMFKRFRKKKGLDLSGNLEVERENDNDSGLRIKIIDGGDSDGNGKVVEIKGSIDSKLVYDYYFEKRVCQLKETQEFEKLTKTKVENLVEKEWKKLDLEQQWELKDEYMKLLASGKDLVNGEIVDLKSLLEDKEDKDGYRLKRANAMQ